MNKKGYTIIELVAAISLIAVIGAAISINLNHIIKKQNTDTYANYVSKVKSSADIYVNDNKRLLNDLNNNNSIVITIKDLIKAGLISRNIINPQTNEKINENDNIKITLENGVLRIEYPI